MKKLIVIILLGLSSSANAQFADSLGLLPFTTKAPFYNIAEGTEFSSAYKFSDREKYYYRDMAFAVFEASNEKRNEVATKACHKEFPVEKMKKTITREKQEERRRLVMDRKMGHQILRGQLEKNILDKCLRKNNQRWIEEPSRETLLCADKAILFTAFKQKKLLSEYEIGKGNLEDCLSNIDRFYPEGDVFPYYNGSFASEYLEEFWNKQSRSCYFKEGLCE